MQPLALALVDSVFALALHHDLRARQLFQKQQVQKQQLQKQPGSVTGLESAAVWAEITGPESNGPAYRGLKVRVSVTLAQTKTVTFFIDLDEGRLLARELALAELPLDRSGLARLVGELEAWCYAQIPLAEPLIKGELKGEPKSEPNPTPQPSQ